MRETEAVAGAESAVEPEPAMAGRRLVHGAIAVIPFAVVVVALLCMVHGLVRFLRGDETLVPVVWAIVAPILLVPAGLVLQIGLVRLAARLYGSVDYEPEDESSFL